MQRIFVFIFVILFPLCAFSQRTSLPKNLPNYDNRLWHFGFTLGGNFMGFRVDKADGFFSDITVYGVECERFTGFHIGPVSNLRLGRFFDFRMLFDLSFNQRDLVFYYMDALTNSDKVNTPSNFGTGSMQTHRMSLTSTMLEFPFHIKYKAERWGNFSPYLIAGGCYKYDLTAGGKAKPDEGDKIRLKRHDPSVEWGGGFDFYLPYFKLSVELKYSVGLLNTLEKDESPYTQSINKLTSNALIFSLHFE